MTRKRLLTLATLALTLFVGTLCTACSDKDKDHKQEEQEEQDQQDKVIALPTSVSDTLAYEFGIAQSAEEEQLKAYLASEMVGSDSVYIKEFLHGVKEGLNSASDKKKAAFYAGISTGTQIGKGLQQIAQQVYGDSTHQLSTEEFFAGFVRGINNSSILKIDGQVVDREKAQQDFPARIQKMTEEATAKNNTKEKAAAERFIAAKAKEAGVKKLPGGTLYKVITEGKGKHVQNGQMVDVVYVGSLANGKVFDQSGSENQNKSVPIQVGNLIPGFNEALLAMPIGSTWELYIPYDQAYGAQSGDKIPPFSALIFKVTLVGVHE